MRKLLYMLCFAIVLSGCYETLDWREWHAEDGSFTLMMPAKPRSFSREVLIGENKLILNMLSTESEGLAFGMAYANVPADASFNLLKDARDALVRNIAGRVSSEKLVEVGQAKGLEFQAIGTSGETPMLMVARILRDDRRFYQIVFVGRQDRAREVDIPFFLESFKPTQ